MKCPLMTLNGHALARPRMSAFGGGKRICSFALHMSAFDPKRTFVGAARLRDHAVGFSHCQRFANEIREPNANKRDQSSSDS